MSAKPKTPDDEADISALIEALRPVKVGRNNYTELDRHRDFKAVFGSTEGKRVLSQIIDFCEGRPIAEDQCEGLGRLSFLAGRRRAGLWIMSKLNPPADHDVSTQG